MTPEMERKQKLRSWAVSILQSDQPADALVVEAAKFIEEEIPALTMKDIRWDDEKHSSALARGNNCMVVMLRWVWPGDKIKCLVLGSYKERYIPVEELTPTGEKYVLQAVDNQS